jgi:hypothetical protein
MVASMLVGIVFSLLQHSEAVPTSVPAKPEVFPLETEITLALSAAPDHLKADAGVWALEATGFVKVRDSKNNFTCIVNRDYPLNLKPTCYDAEGTATILPKVAFIGNEMMAGKAMQEIAQEVADGFKAGRFISPRRPGVAYMLSHDNRNFNPKTGQVDLYPPHVMFYAPNLQAGDIGSAGESHEGLPFIAYQGAQGYIMVVVPEYENASTTARVIK